MEKCNFCNGEAIYHRPYSGEHHCELCYIKAVEKQVQRTITRHRMLKPDDYVAIAVSGGKDSVSLIHIISTLEARFPQSKLVAITIDEGVSGYRSEAIDIARECCEKFGIEHRLHSFKKLYGYTLDEIAECAKEKGVPHVCSYCGVLRRKALNVAAREAQATKLATAHNLDDEVQSMVMNFLRGDISRMSGHQLGLECEGLVPRVKPLCKVPEKEVALYAFLKKVRFQSLPCPYSETSLRSDVRRFLNKLENKHPGMKFTVYKSFGRVQQQLRFQEERRLSRCNICGEPTSRETCMACQMLRKLAT